MGVAKNNLVLYVRFPVRYLNSYFVVTKFSQLIWYMLLVFIPMAIAPEDLFFIITIKKKEFSTDFDACKNLMSNRSF